MARMVGKYLVVLTLIGVIFLAGPRMVAADEAADLSQLKAEVAELEAENRSLQQDLDGQQTLTERLLKRVEGLERKDTVLTEQVQRVASRPIQPIALEPLGEVSTVGIPKLQIKGFGDIGYTLLNKGSSQDHAFWLGAIDLFWLSQLNDRLSFMLETDFHWHSTDPRTNHMHVERANVKYALSDLVNIKLGKMHTALGYWNQTYHHGSWLQTTIFRPEIYEFERPAVFGNPQGGWLPVHSIGVELSGTMETELADIGYNIGVFNGRPDDKNDVSNVQDQNQFKAVNAHLSFSPRAIEGLTVGGSIYGDKIAAETAGGAALTFTEGIDEVIVGWYATYYGNDLELLGETFFINHDERDSERHFGTWAGYAQFGYQVDKYTPYYRFDFIDWANGDPYWDGLDQDFIKHTIGLRYDLYEWNALKFEYSHVALQGARQAGEDEHHWIANSSWAF